MGTTGSVDVNLTPYGYMVSNSADIGAKVITGVRDQGDLIGLAIGLTIAIGLLFGVVILLLGLIVVLIRKTKGLKHA